MFVFVTQRYDEGVEYHFSKTKDLLYFLSLASPPPLQTHSYNASVTDRREANLILPTVDKQKTSNLHLSHFARDSN